MPPQASSPGWCSRSVADKHFGCKIGSPGSYSGRSYRNSTLMMCDRKMANTDLHSARASLRYRIATSTSRMMQVSSTHNRNERLFGAFLPRADDEADIPMTRAASLLFT